LEKNLSDGSGFLQMDPLFWPTLLLTGILFLVGEHLSSRSASAWPAVVGILIAIPAVVFAAYYTKIFGEAMWLYWFRSLPFTELTGAGIGFIAGWLQGRRRNSPRWSRKMSGFLIPFLTMICVAAPYLKQMFLRPDWSRFQNRWINNVCVQSSESSCGPASAATLLRYFGKTATEMEIARESFTSRRGTENWYLIRALRHRGLAASYAVVAPGADHLLFPAIAGVKLNQADGSGHFIALLGKTGDNYIVGDPLMGREELPIEKMNDRYTFTGFYLIFAQESQLN
jgi:hypothetical protein